MKLFTLSLILASTLCLSVHARELRGVVLERGTRKPLDAVNVFLLPSKAKATTDSTGAFRFENVEAGPTTVVINATGFQRLEEELILLSDAPPDPTVLYVEKVRYEVYETTVVGKAKKTDDTSRSLRASEVTKIAGSGNDPIKALQNLPGINRPAPFQSQVIIQGSAPQDTRYQVDGHEVPLIFHFGGLTSVVPPEALDRVEYLSAGYGPSQGRAIGGLVGVWTRSPRTDRVHGMGFVDIFNFGGMLEGPAGEKGSFLFSARKSYIGAVLKKVLPKNGDFDLTVAPSFSDVTAIYEKEVTPIDTFRWVNIGSVDELQFLFAQPADGEPSIRGDFYYKTAFFRLIPQWIHRHSAVTESRLSLGMGRDWFKIDLGQDYFFLNTYALTPRGEVERKMSNTWTSTWGFDNRYSWARVDLQLPQTYAAGGIFNPFSSGTMNQATISSRYSQLGLFWKNEVRLNEDSKWTLLPGVRGEYYSSTQEIHPLPRLGARYQAQEYLSFRAGGGKYAQPPLEQEVDATVGNPDIKSPQAWHLSVSAEKDFREGSSQGFTVTPGLFYKYLDQLVVPSSKTIQRGGQSVPERYRNDGRGRVYGFELLTKAQIAPFTGWLSYTLSKSTRWNDGQAEYPSQYDQTHLLTLVGTYELPRNWSVGGRLRYATGNPSTPVVGSTFDADNDVFVPTRGAYFSERLEPFYQLDLRADKKWIFNTWILSAYLDIQNVTSRKNPERVQYAYDYKSKSIVSGLPLLPTIGLKGEF